MRNTIIDMTCPAVGRSETISKSQDSGRDSWGLEEGMPPGSRWCFEAFIDGPQPPTCLALPKRETT